MRQKQFRGTADASARSWAVATAAAWRYRAVHRWFVRRRTRSSLVDVAIGRATVARGVVPLAVEELDLPIAGVLVGGEVRFDRHDLPFHGKHFGDRAAVERVQLRPGRRQQEGTSLGELVETGLRRAPERAVGFGVLTVGTLPLRQCTDEEKGVVATGALLFRRHPIRPRPK